MSGEFLRKVMTEEAAFNAIGFYTLTLPALPNPVVYGQRLTAVLQAKKDRWFLATSIYYAKIAQGPPQGFTLMSGSGLVELYDPSSSKVYWTPGTDAGDVGGPVATAYTLPEYILIEPGSLIGAAYTPINFLTASNPGDVVFLTLSGIEYAMPPGKG